MIEFKLPSLGADMDEGKLLEWKIKPGDTVRRGDIVAVVDTSKAAVDVESWDSGVVHLLLVEPGETIPVGTVMAILLAPGEAPPPSERFASRPPPTTVAVAPAPTGATTSAAAAAPAAVAPRAVAPVITADGARRRVSPAARRRARELDVDIDSVPATGPEGAVTLEDIEAAAMRAHAPSAPPPATPAAARPASAPSAPAAPADRAEAMRRAMAAAMSRSKREIPHYYLARTLPLRTASNWLTAHNAGMPVTGRILMATLFIKAVALACKRHPAMNGFCHEGAFSPSSAVHVGVAISLRGGGLVAPAIHDADTKDLATLMAELADLVRRARAGSLRSSEMSDPTITVTNLGDQGADEVFGVIYPPQVALVGFGAVAERALVVDGRIGIEPCVSASLAGDHRVSSGHQGALFLAEIAQTLSQPEKL